MVPTGCSGGECYRGPPSLPAQPVKQTSRPSHERQRQRHQDQVRQPLLLQGVHPRLPQADHRHYVRGKTGKGHVILVMIILLNKRTFSYIIFF